MRVLVHDFSGHPFQVQLSRALARRGHEVTHAFCPSYVSGKGALDQRPTDPSSFRVVPVPMSGEFAKHSVLRRLLQEFAYGLRIGSLVRKTRPEVVLSCNGGLISQWLLMAQSHAAKAAFVWWMQDITSASASEYMKQRFGRLSGVASVTSRIERSLARRSDHVIPIGSAMREVLTDWGVAPERVDEIHNWSPVEEHEVAPKDNAWARAHDLVDKFVFLYAGTLGFKHQADLLLDLAASLQNGSCVVVVSEGAQVDRLAEEAKRSNLSTLGVLPFQPFDELSNMLGAADVVVALLSPEASRYSEPSKVLTYLCAERPILAALPASLQLAKWLGENSAAVIVDSEQTTDGRARFLKEAVELASNEALRHQLSSAARELAERSFKIDPIASRFERVLLNSTNRVS